MNIKTKLFLWIALSVLSTLLLLPLPFGRVYITHDNLINPEKNPIEFKIGAIYFPTLAEVVFTSIDIPSNVKYYDLHVKNFNKNFDWEFQWPINNDDSALSYLVKKFEATTTEKNITRLLIRPKTSTTIYGIPIQIIPTNAHGLMASCGFTSPTVSCPTEPILEIDSDTLQIFATPNLFSWFIQFVLIWSFWMIVIQTFLEFIKSK